LVIRVFTRFLGTSCMPRNRATTHLLVEDELLRLIDDELEWTFILTDELEFEELDEDDVDSNLISMAVLPSMFVV